jgi:hypothetical protein
MAGYVPTDVSAGTDQTLDSNGSTATAGPASLVPQDETIAPMINVREQTHRRGDITVPSTDVVIPRGLRGVVEDVVVRSGGDWASG